MTDGAERVSGSNINILQLNGTFEAFGLVMDFVVQVPPFSKFEAKALADALLLQLRLSNHLVAMQGNRMVGYAGWLHTSREVGEAWMNGFGKLNAISADKADAASLTIVRSTDNSATRRLLRGARELNPGRLVYFKRDANPTQTTRKRSVQNVTLSK